MPRTLYLSSNGNGGVMRIANILFARSLGGLEQVFLDYGRALTDRGHEVHMICHPDSAFPPVLREMGLTTHTLANLGQWDPLAPMKLRRLLDRIKPDIALCHGNRALSLLNGPVARLFGRPDYPVIGVAANYKLKRFAKLDGALTPTADLREILKKEHGLPADMVFHVPNMIAMPNNVARRALPVVPEARASSQRLADNNKSLPSAGRSEYDMPVIGAIGRFVHKKGFDVFLEALALLRDRGYSFKAVLAGDGEEEKQALLDLVKARQLEGLVEFPGWVTDKASFYSGIDIFCLPSRHEPFGIVLLEAMAWHLPIVSTDTEGPSEFLTHNEDALVVPKGDAALLADAFARLLEQPTLCQRLGAKACIKVKEQYSMEVVGRRLSEAVTKLAAHHRERQAA